MTTPKPEGQDEAAVEHALNHLASLPNGNTTVTRKQLKLMLLKTDGWMLSRGRLCDIKSKHLGAGVYRVELQERP